MYIRYNPNPFHARVGDCTVRAIAKATGDSWEHTYIMLSLHGLIEGDMPSANVVWGKYLRSKGFRRFTIPDICPDCYTVNDFEVEHPEGTYIVALNGHVVCVVDGNHYDTWDSGDMNPIYYWTKEA